MQDLDRAEKYTRGAAYAHRSGLVRRYHTIPTVHPQSVGEHSYNVAWFCWALTGACPTATLLMAALAHDVPEYDTGDIPAVTKAVLDKEGDLERLENLVLMGNGLHTVGKGLTPLEKRILKLADILDGLAYSLMEVKKGNYPMKICAKNYAAYLEQYDLTGMGEWPAPIVAQLMSEYYASE